MQQTTRTVTKQKTNNETITMYLKKHKNSSSSPSSPSSSESSQSQELEGILPCNKIINIYASIKILYKIRGSYVSPTGYKYHLIIPTTNFIETMSDLLDPVEFAIYEKLMFNGKAILIPYRKDKKQFKKGDTLYFVRCENNSLHFVKPSDIPKGIALDRFNYNNTRVNQERINTRSHHVFEREKLKVIRDMIDLFTCENSQSNFCKQALRRSCENETKDAKLLKEIYHYGLRNTKIPNRSWEEVCNNKN